MTNAEPISRFWSCFFSHGIFALFWTLKMKKTRMWLLLCILPQIIFSVIPYALIPLVPNGVENIYLGFFFVGVAYIPMLLWVNSIYFMYKWTSIYNLKEFGYESHGQWRSSQKPDAPTPKVDPISPDIPQTEDSDPKTAPQNP